MSLNSCNFLWIMTEGDRGAQCSNISRSSMQVWGILDMTLHLLWNLFTCSFSSKTVMTSSVEGLA